MIRRLLAFIAFIALLGAASPAALPPSDLLHWRAIGPFRGGRTEAVTGVPGHPHTFYIAASDGGVFKTTDAGRTWKPVFDDQPSASIGALAVAPSQPETIYAGSGEGRQRPDLSTGDGIYKSTDGGVHWAHLGLRDAQQIPRIVVDPRDANRLFVAVLGHPYGPNEERGLYRSTDGGATFARVLGGGPDDGAFDVTLDPVHPDVVYATIWAARQKPWETNDAASFQRYADNGLFKSIDGGAHWTKLTAGLPSAAEGIGRVAVSVAAKNAQRVYVFANAEKRGGVYRSDDGGAHFVLVNADARDTERGDDLVTIAADPQNPDVVYETNTSTYKSTDGGKTFVAWRGAPGGDDYQGIWINPSDPRIIALSSDQGAIVTLNGGASWSSWYNQPTAQFYHVITDDEVPYRVYGGQQESGSAGVLSRGNDGAITFRDWHPVGVEEYGYAAPDPLHPGIVYGGKVSRYDMRTGQVQNVGPQLNWRGGSPLRFRRTAPLAFSPVDRRTLYLGAQMVMASSDYGMHWRAISSDLSRPAPAMPASVGTFVTEKDAVSGRRGVVYALGLSPRDRNVLWAGTDDGFIWHTADGGATWRNVTPPGVDAWAKVSIIDASPLDRNAAYVAVNRFRLDQQRPELWRTRDGGATWTRIDGGIDAAPTNTIKADPVRRGLLFAGTERGVWYSLDDGDSWSSLRLNLPATSVRDLVVHGDDLVIGTHGRGFWILDDITPLRQAAALHGAQAALLAPAPVWRFIANTNGDTPLPPDEPFFANAPDGAYFDYVLPHDVQRVRLTIADERGRVLRTLASDDRTTLPANPDELDVPAWWIAPATRPLATAGAHRFVWDLRVARPRTDDYGPTIAAVPGRTELEPAGARIPPGRYTVVLDADGVRSSQPLTVREDPRVHVADASIAQQFAFLGDVAAAMNAAYDRARTDTVHAAELKRINRTLATLYSDVQSSDAAPTPMQRDVYRTARATLAQLGG